MNFAPQGVRRQIATAFSWLLAEQITQLIASLVVGVALARYLGPTDFGLLNFVLAMVALVVPFAGLGLNHILTKDLVTRPEIEGALLGTVAALTLSGGILATVVMATWLAIFPIEHASLTFYILLIVATRCVSVFGFLQFWFLAKDMQGYYSRTRIATMTGFAGLRLVMLLLNASLDAFLVLAAAEAVFEGLRAILAYLSKRHLVVRWRFDFALARNLLGRSWPMIVGGVTGVIYLKLDIVMLSSMRSAEVAGIYSVASRLSEIWYVVPGVLLSAAFPPLLRLRASDQARYRMRIQDLLDLMAAAGMAIAVVTCLLAPYIVSLLFGEAYAAAAPILMVHVWAGVFIFMRAVLSKWILAEGLYTLSLCTQASGALMNVFLNVLLIPEYGGMGAAVATLISYSVASYFSLILFPSTKPMFWNMTKALFWVRRAPEMIAMIRRRFST